MAKRNTFRVDETLQEEFNMRHILLASKYIKRYLSRMLLAMLMSAVAAGAALFAPMITQQALDRAIPEKDTNYLITLVILLIVAFIVSIIFVTIRQRIMVKVSQNIIFDIRKDLFAHLQKLSFDYYDSRPHGKILIRVVNYVNSVSDMLSNGLINTILEMINLVFIVIFMFIADVEMSLMVLCCVLFLSAFMFCIKN